MNKKYSLLILLALLLPLGLQAQKPPQDMDRFLDNLLKRMTLEEKISIRLFYFSYFRRNSSSTCLLKTCAIFKAISNEGL